MKSILASIFTSILLLFASCNKPGPDPVYKERMRTFVQGISSYSKQAHPGFIIISQNGHELVTESGEMDDPILAVDYLNSIDGAGQEDLFYGYSRDDKATAEKTTEYLSLFLNICESNNVEVLVTDYCSSTDHINDSYSRNNNAGYISFSAPNRELNVIPDYPGTIYNRNLDAISDLSMAQNFLYLINPENFNSAEEFVNAVSLTDYDIVIIDFFFNNVEYTTEQIEALRRKSNGTRRLLIAYMSIGEAEDYRFYWKPEWDSQTPSWIETENPEWEGNYKVKYWDASWQSLIYGSTDSYLDKILAADFDGVYLDIIDAFEYFE